MRSSFFLVNNLLYEIRTEILNLGIFLKAVVHK